MKAELFSLIAILFLNSCSTTYRASSPEEANRKIAGRDAKVILTGGREYEAREILVRKDSSSFIDNNTNDIQVVSTHDIVSIQRTDRWGGALEGLMFGALGGGVTGFALTSPSSHGDQAGLGVALATFHGIAIGGIGGLIYGVTEGHVYTVELEKDSLGASGSTYFEGKQDSTNTHIYSGYGSIKDSQNRQWGADDMMPKILGKMKLVVFTSGTRATFVVIGNLSNRAMFQQL